MCVSGCGAFSLPAFLPAGSPVGCCVEHKKHGAERRCCNGVAVCVSPPTTGVGLHSLATNISLLRVSEVDEVVEGNDEKYKAVCVSTEPPVSR